MGSILIPVKTAFFNLLSAERQKNSETEKSVCSASFFLKQSKLRVFLVTENVPLRDGPLENLWAGGRAKYKKNIRAREN